MRERTRARENGRLPTGRRRSVGEQPRAVLRRRLEARGAEMLQAILTRVYGIADPDEVGDPEYVQGLRRAVSAGLDFGFVTVSRDEGLLPPVPVALLAQARAAARGGVSLDTVLRRYYAAQALLSDFIVEEAERGGLLGKGVLQQVLRTQGVLMDRLLLAVSEEHTRELAGRPGSSDLRRAECVERLLAGELVDTSLLAYEFDGHHVGMVATGAGAEKAIRDLAAALDRRLLSVEHGKVIWAWLGGRQPLDPDRLVELAVKALPVQRALAIGEPGEGLDGWRLTHRQAAAAHPIALRRAQGPVRYAKVALLAAALRDDLFAASLHSLYLAPLEAERDGGEKLRRTLRAHFATDSHISSTASALGVNRNTVMNRRHKIEALFGRTLGSCAAELETALALDEFRRLPDPPVV